jgi:succinoglycan biosynthesis transport protein ExoP
MADERVRPDDPQPEDKGALVRVGYAQPLVQLDGMAFDSGGESDSAKAGFDIRTYWLIVRKRKWLIISLALVCTTLAVIQMYRIKSRYQAQSLVEIGRDVDIAETADELLAGKDSDPSRIIMSKTYMLEVTSDPVLQEVVVNLGLDKDPSFLDVWLYNSPSEAIDVLLGRSHVPAEAKPASAPPQPKTGRPEQAPQRSTEERQRLKPFVSTLRDNLIVAPMKEAPTVLQISFGHTSPSTAAAVANGLATTLVDRNFANKTAKYADTSEWLERNTRELKIRAEQAERALATYAAENDIHAGTNLTNSNLTRLYDQAMRAETERLLKQSLHEEVKAGKLTELPQSFVDPRIEELQNTLNGLEVTAAQLGVKFGPDNPKVREVKQQIQVIQDQIVASRKILEAKLQADYERAEQDEISLKAALDEAKAEATRQNQLSTMYSILKQEVDTANSLYTDFLQKSSAARVRLAEQYNNMRVLAPATVPGSPVSPYRLLVILGVLLISLAAGVGAAILLESLDQTVRTVSDVHRFLHLPALAVIPTLSLLAPARRKDTAKGTVALGLAEGAGGQSAPVVLGATSSFESDSPVAEAYRVLRTAVLLSAAEVPPKTILVTSTQPDEGKTTTVLNTAISLAQLDKSVVIVDCDLRKPSKYKGYTSEQTHGLSSYLIREVRLEKLIHKLSVDGPAFLPSGLMPPNPSELISSDRMKTLLETLSQQYDFVLIDSPPLLCAIDALVLSTLVDGVLLVVHSGKNSRQAIQHACRELRNVGATIVGVVLNNVDIRRDGNDQFYYSRYYANYGGEADRASTP